TKRLPVRELLCGWRGRQPLHARGRSPTPSLRESKLRPRSQRVFSKSTRKILGDVAVIQLRARPHHGRSKIRWSLVAQASRRLKVSSQARAICCCASVQSRPPWLYAANGPSASSADSKARDIPFPVT